MMVYDFGKVLTIGYYILPVLSATKSVDGEECKVCQNAGCTSVMIINSDIACHVTYTTPEGKPPEENDPESWTLSNPSKTITSATRKIQCGKVTSAVRESKTQKEQCRTTPCEDHDILAPEDGQSCILYRRENITLTAEKPQQLLKIPLALKPGMRMSVNACYKKGEPYSQMSVATDPKHRANFFSWIHIRPHWAENTLQFTEGMSSTYYDGDFPFSDPCCFSLALELTPTATKIYANTEVVKTVKFIPGIDEFNLHWFSKVHLLMVQKTGAGCD